MEIIGMLIISREWQSQWAIKEINEVQIKRIIIIKRSILQKYFMKNPKASFLLILLN